MKRTYLLLGAAILGGLVAPIAGRVAKAGIVGGEQVGVGLGGGTSFSLTPPANWTVFGTGNSSGSTTALDLSTGNPIAGVTVSFTTPNGSINGISNSSFGNAITDAPTGITTDGGYGGNSVIDVTFSGLSNALKYNLEVFAGNNYGNSGDPSSAIINGVPESFAAGFQTSLERYGQPTGAFLNGLSTNGSGVLDFQIYNADGNPILNGIRLTAVAPEPSAATLFGLGAAGLLLAGRRSRKA